MVKTPSSEVGFLGSNPSLATSPYWTLQTLNIDSLTANFTLDLELKDTTDYRVTQVMKMFGSENKQRTSELSDCLSSYESRA